MIRVIVQPLTREQYFNANITSKSFCLNPNTQTLSDLIEQVENAFHMQIKELFSNHIGSKKITSIT